MSSKIIFSYKQSDNISNNVVLFIHGFMGNKNDWDPIIRLLENNYNCLAIDLPGHGEATTPDNDQLYSIEETSAQLANFIRSKFSKKISLVGYSMGGRVAWNLICNYEELFDKAIIESSTPGISNLVERDERTNKDCQLAEKLNSESIAEFVDFWYDLPLFATLKSEPDKLEKFKKRKLSNNKESLAKSILLGSPGKMISLWEKLENINIPIHLIVGEKDDKFKEINLNVKSKLKNCNMTIVENAGHNVHFEQPNKFAEIVETFLIS